MAPSLYKNRKIILLHINLLADIKQIYSLCPLILQALSLKAYCTVCSQWPPDGHSCPLAVGPHTAFPEAGWEPLGCVFQQQLSLDTLPAPPTSPARVPSLSSPPAAPCFPAPPGPTFAFHKGGATPRRRERIPTPNTNGHSLTSVAFPQSSGREEYVYLVPLTLHNYGQG